MRIYMLRRTNSSGVWYYNLDGSWGTQEEGTIWTCFLSVSVGQQRTNFPCEVASFSLASAENICPDCGLPNPFAHGSVQCIKVLKANIERLTKQRDRARESRNRLLNEEYSPTTTHFAHCDICGLSKNSGDCRLCAYN